MGQHPFAPYRDVMIAIRRPMAKLLGTEAARVKGMSKAHLKGHATRRAPALELARAMREAMERGR